MKKKVKCQEFRNQASEHLEGLSHDLQSEIFDLRNELAGTRKVEKPHLIKAKKKERAQLLTVLSERKKRA